MKEKLEISYVPANELSDADLEARNISRKDYMAMRAARIEREKSAPRIGEPAPDFEIERLDADGKRGGRMFRLSSTRGRPVALILGSYT